MPAETWLASVPLVAGQPLPKRGEICSFVLGRQICTEERLGRRRRRRRGNCKSDMQANGSWDKQVWASTLTTSTPETQAFGSQARQVKASGLTTANPELQATGSWARQV